MWVAKELNLDGVRLDAIKHMRDTFVKQFLETVRASRESTSTRSESIGTAISTRWKPI